MKPNIYFLVLVIFVDIAISCKKFVQIDPAPDLIQTDAIFQSDKTALAAVSGVYLQLRANNTVLSNGGQSLYGGLLSDELKASSATTTTDAFYLNQLTSTNSVINTSFYSLAYKCIYQVNTILEGLGKSNALTATVKSQLTGEMKVIRALLYFYLSNLFGDIPLVLTTDFRVNAVMPRTPVAIVQQQIVADLESAQSSLTESYPSDGRVRPNQHTATALLARMYLYQKRWSEAETMATRVINAPIYSLRPSSAINSVFLKNSTETIWEIASPSEATAVAEAVNFVPASSTVKPTYALSIYLLGAFEPGDLRKSSANWVGKNTVSGVDYYYPAKFRQRTISSGGIPTEYQVVFRLSEQYLIRAEARTQLNNLNGARSDLNAIRNRAGLGNSTVVTQGDLLGAIEKENQVEFFCEWGHRWLDLKRSGHIDATLSNVKGTNWQSTDALFPIPENERNLNPFLTQNPGY